MYVCIHADVDTNNVSIIYNRKYLSSASNFFYNETHANQLIVMICWPSGAIRLFTISYSETNTITTT